MAEHGYNLAATLPLSLFTLEHWNCFYLATLLTLSFEYEHHSYKPQSHIATADFKRPLLWNTGTDDMKTTTMMILRWVWDGLGQLGDDTGPWTDVLSPKIPL